MQTPRITIPVQDSSQEFQQSQQQPPQSNAQTSSNAPRRSPGFFVYPERIINEGVSACNKSLLGKIITTKPIHVSSIQMGLENIWGSPSGLKIQENEGKILQFFMDEIIDQERILQGNPWIFRNSWLIVQPWDRNSDVASLDFNHAPVWIQLWGLPNHCKTKQMGESIGALLGKVEASELYEYPGKKVIVKIRVAINVYQPIQTCILIGNHRDGTRWIDYKYENLPQVCFNCGILGHGEKFCMNEAIIVKRKVVTLWITTL
jgi:hypothetical protein